MTRPRRFAREAFLAVAELTGSAAASRIILAAPITLDEIELRFAEKIEDRAAVTFEPASASLRARRSRRLGALVLAEQTRPVLPDAQTAHILAQGIAGLGIDTLAWSKATLQFRNRVQFLRQPKVTSGRIFPMRASCKCRRNRLEPLLVDKTARGEVTAEQLADAVAALVAWTLRRRLDAEAPTHFMAPTGSHVPIDYEAEQRPTLSIRVQELFGLARHPAIAGGRVPLVIELLSPAHRPVQVTRDLPGFWRGSYSQVKAEMRGRYPRHPWPDDPLSAPPTRRASAAGNSVPPERFQLRQRP